jgi:hypothetical protein
MPTSGGTTDFVISRYNPLGTWVDNPLAIIRTSGQMNIASSVINATSSTLNVAIVTVQRGLPMQPILTLQDTASAMQWQWGSGGTLTLGAAGRASLYNAVHAPGNFPVYNNLTPQDGDLWYDGTHLNFQQGATTVVVA